MCTFYICDNWYHLIVKLYIASFKMRSALYQRILQIISRDQWRKIRATLANTISMHAPIRQLILIQRSQHTFLSWKTYKVCVTLFELSFCFDNSHKIIPDSVFDKSLAIPISWARFNSSGSLWSESTQCLRPFGRTGDIAGEEGIWCIEQVPRCLNWSRMCLKGTMFSASSVSSQNSYFLSARRRFLNELSFSQVVSCTSSVNSYAFSASRMSLWVALVVLVDWAGTGGGECRFDLLRGLG